MASRNFVTPEPGDDLVSVATRVLPAAAPDDAAHQVLSWNLHLAARAGLGRSVGLLPSDIVFTEPPLPAPSPADP